MGYVRSFGRNSVRTEKIRKTCSRMGANRCEHRQARATWQPSASGVAKTWRSCALRGDPQQGQDARPVRAIGRLPAALDQIASGPDTIGGEHLLSSSNPFSSSATKASSSAGTEIGSSPAGPHAWRREGLSCGTPAFSASALRRSSRRLVASSSTTRRNRRAELLHIRPRSFSAIARRSSGLWARQAIARRMIA